MKNGKWILLAVLLVALIAGAGVLYNNLKDQVEIDNMVVAATQMPVPSATAVAAEQPTARPKAAAPDFTVLDEQDNEVKLSSFVGKPVVVNFWASWCGPCKNEMPSFQEAWEKYGDQVQFMIVNMTDGVRETQESAKAYLEKQGYTFPVYFDVRQEAALGYRVMSIPTTCFIAPDGSLTARVSGSVSLGTLERGIGMITE